jgi:hypothetical protein
MYWSIKVVKGDDIKAKEEGAASVYRCTGTLRANSEGTSDKAR